MEILRGASISWIKLNDQSRISEIIRNSLKEGGIETEKLDIEGTLSDDPRDINPGHSTNIHNAISSLKVLKNADIQEYHYKSTKIRKPNLDLLRRIAIRKMSLITEDGRKLLDYRTKDNIEKYVTILLDDLDLDMFTLKDESPINTAELNPNFKKSKLSSYLGRGKLSFFFHFDNDIAREGAKNYDLPADLSCAFELKEKDKLEDFLNTPMTLIYVSLEDAINEVQRIRGKNIVDFDKKSTDVEELIDNILTVDWWFKDIHGKKFIDIYTFLAVFAWMLVVQPIRRYLKSEHIIKNLDETHRSGRKFVNALRERYNILYYESISLDFEDLYEYNKFLAEINFLAYGKGNNKVSSETERLLSNFFGISRRPTTGAEYVRVVQDEFNRNNEKYIGVDQEFALYYQNKRLWWGYFDNKSNSDQFILPSIWWDVAWDIILSDVLTFSAQMFLSYDRNIEKHTNSKKFAELKKITTDAISDFKNYYEVGVFSPRFIDTFFVARKQFGIDEYYRIIKEKLDMFGNYEVAQSEHDQNIIISGGGLIGVMVLIITMYFVVFVPFLKGKMIQIFQYADRIIVIAIIFAIFILAGYVFGTRWRNNR
jgi:hypothetical protein